MRKLVVALLVIGFSPTVSFASDKTYAPLGLDKPLEAAGYCADAAIIAAEVAAELSIMRDNSLIADQDIFHISLERMTKKHSGAGVNDMARTASTSVTSLVITNLVSKGRNPNDSSDRHYLIARAAAECMTTQVHL